METVLQDLRYAVRNLFRQPGFAATAIFTLALGIGATTAIFSVVNAVVLRALPYEAADRVVSVANYYPKIGVRPQNVSAPDFHDWHEQNRSFSALAYHTGGQNSVTVQGSADYAGTIAITSEYFDVLRARAQLGRLFSPAEQRPGGSLAVVITDAFWRSRFNASRTALGSTVKFDERIYEIVGVLAPGIRYPVSADIYYPSWVVPETPSRSGHNYRSIARLRDGVTLEQANADMVEIARRLEQEHPTTNDGKSASVLRLHDVVVGETRTTLYVLLAAVSFVLLIACANVANLLLARSTVRSREMVVRAAVGAGRGRLVRQLLTESLLLGVVSGLAGILLAKVGVAALIALAPANLPRLDEVRIDEVTLGFALLISIASSVIFGMAPAVQVSRVQLVEGLRAGGKGSALGARGAWARNAFVVVEVALAVVLVVGAGLLGRSLVALADVNMGFAPERLLVMRTSVPIARMQDGPRASAFYRDLLPELRAIAGVLSVGGVTSLPTAVQSNGRYWVEGTTSLDELGMRAPQAIFNVVTPGYFQTMKIVMRAGRDFNESDRMDGRFAVIINEALARQSFPAADPIGHRIQCGLDSPELMTVVGVVADVRTEGPSRPAQPELYMPYEQHPAPAADLAIVARTQSADPLSLTETMRRIIRERNPDVPMRAETMEMTLQNASATPRFRTFLLVVFATVALLLAVAGVYGVMAYTVSQRVPEIGVRVALGASPRDILTMIVGQGAKLAGLGLALGVVLALGAARLLQGLLFGVTGSDPIILTSVVILVSAAALGACYIPGRRALRIEPTIALRAE